MRNGRFRVTVTMMADADTTGEVRRYLVATDSLGLSAPTAEEVFARAIGTLIDDMPGLMHSIYDRDDNRELLRLLRPDMDQTLTEASLPRGSLPSDHNPRHRTEVI